MKFPLLVSDFILKTSESAKLIRQVRSLWLISPSFKFQAPKISPKSTLWTWQLSATRIRFSTLSSITEWVSRSWYLSFLTAY